MKKKIIIFVTLISSAIPVYIFAKDYMYVWFIIVAVIICGLTLYTMLRLASWANARDYYYGLAKNFDKENAWNECSGSLIDQMIEQIRSPYTCFRTCNEITLRVYLWWGYTIQCTIATKSIPTDTVLERDGNMIRFAHRTAWFVKQISLQKKHQIFVSKATTT